MLKNIINFIKYHNLFTLTIIVIFVGGSSAFAASPQLREKTGDALIGKTETIISVDNTTLLNTNFDNFDPELAITAVSEDTGAYYVSYTFSTLTVLDGAWGSTTKDGELTVPKDNLNNTDLQTYVEEELKEVAQAEIKYLKEAKEVEQKKGDIKKKTVVAYTGLLGLVIDAKEKEVEYKTVDEPTPEPEPESIIEPTTNLVTPLPSTVPSTATTTATTTPNQSSQSSDDTGQAPITTEETSTSTPSATEETATTTATTTDNGSGDEGLSSGNEVDGGETLVETETSTSTPNQSSQDSDTTGQAEEIATSTPQT